MRDVTKLLRPLLLPIVLLTISAGCLEPKRLSAGHPLPYWVVDKSIFDDGDGWWAQRTVVEAPYTAGWTFIGDGDLGERIRWRIEEGFLIAERDQSYVTGVDGLDVADDHAPYAVYPITRHFDVLGGQLVTPPNATWRDMKYMRVDWSNNLINSFRFTFTLAAREALSTWIDDPSDANAPSFGPEFIDFTTRALFRADNGADPVTGRQVDCLSSTIVFYTDCAPLEVMFRTSFKKVPASHQYEQLVSGALPPPWDGTSLFSTVTVGIGGSYGVDDQDVVQHLTRYGIWKETSDARGPLPYRERTPRPIVFHVTEGFPDDVLPIAREAIAAWNEPLREVVRDLRAYECVNDGDGDIDACRASVEVPEQMMALCESWPVRSSDAALCGPEGLKVRLGDIRYNALHWASDATINQPMAITWWTPDAQTGEAIASHIKLAEPQIRKNVTVLSDDVLIAMGELDLASVGLPAEISSWTSGLRSRSIASQQRDGSQLSAPRRALASGGDWSTPFQPLRGSPIEGSLASFEDSVAAGRVDGGTSPLLRPYRTALDVADAYRRGTRGIAEDTFVELDTDSLARLLLGESEANVRAFVRHEVLMQIFMHELGHALGLRHNFAGTYDALNFEDEYWAARRTDCGPRSTCVGPAFSEAELDAQIHGYATSSVMDYSSAVAPGLGRLGRFDIAAVKALYGSFVEVFADPNVAANPDAVATARAIDRMGTVHAPVIATASATEPVRFVHYTEFPAIFGDLAAREFVPASTLVGDGALDTAGRLRVPYMSCDDRLADAFSWCAPFDVGADPFEIVAGADAWYRQRYPWSFFRRGRASWDSTKVISELQRRYFLRLKRINAQLAQTREDLRDYPDVLDNDPGFAVLLDGTVAALRSLSRVMQTPSAGPHRRSDVLLPSTTALVAHREQAGGLPLPVETSDAVIALGAGRVVNSRLTDFGEVFAIDAIGSFIEKELALEALIEPAAWTFPNVDPMIVATQGSYDTWTSNFVLSFPEETTALLASIIAGDADTFPFVDNGEVVFRDMLAMGTETLPPGAEPLSSALPFHLRARALAYLVSLANGGYLPGELSDFSRIRRIGSTEVGLPPPPGDPALVVQFADPLSGDILAADRYAASTNAAAELGVGARVLVRADDLATRMLAETDPRAQQELSDLLIEQLLVVGIIRGVIDAFVNVEARPDDPGSQGAEP